MIDVFNQIFSALLTIDHPAFTNLKHENQNFSFEYGGGQFRFIRTLSANLKIGYLRLYHLTPLINSKMIEVKDFVIKVEKYSYGNEIKIKNFFEPNNWNRHREDEEGFVEVTTQTLQQYFPMQLEKKLIQDNFVIYL